MTISATRPAPISNRDDALPVAEGLVETVAQPSRGWLRPALVERALPLLDALAIIGCGIGSAAAYHLYTVGDLGKLNVYAAASVLVAINFCLLIAVQHGYRLSKLAERGRQARMTAATWSMVFAVLLALGFSMKVSEEFSRGTVMTFFAVGLAALLAGKAATARLVAHALRAGTFANSRAVVIAEFGMPPGSRAMAELRQNGYRLEQILEIAPDDLGSPLLMSRIGPRLDRLIDYARQNRIEQIFILMRWDRQHAIDSLLDALKILPLPVHLVPDVHVARFMRYPQIGTGAIWTAELRRAPLTLPERALKRAMDLAGASLALLLFSPVMLAAALLIKADSRGPILFRQTRNGFNGRAFRIFKFRSMSVTEDGPIIAQAKRHDPRVTRVGRWLRKTSIDELPQLFNVLRGEMSLVGPRPHAAAHNSEYEKLIAPYAFRHHVKPGITGWAQINGLRGETSTVAMMEKRVEMDLWYINNWSVWLDLRIVLGTTVVAFRDGAAY